MKGCVLLRMRICKKALDIFQLSDVKRKLFELVDYVGERVGISGESNL